VVGTLVAVSVPPGGCFFVFVWFCLLLGFLSDHLVYFEFFLSSLFWREFGVSRMVARSLLFRFGFLDFVDGCFGHLDGLGWLWIY